MLTDGVTTVRAPVAMLRTMHAFTLVGAAHPGADACFAWSVPTDAVPAAPGHLDATIAP